MPLLEVRDLNTAYGSSQVLFGLGLEVARGEVVALLGRNGAGKTTTLSSIMGLVPPRAGTIRFHDRDIFGWAPFAACRLGLGYVPENSRLFTNLSIAENFEAAKLAPRRPDSPRAWDLKRVLDLFPDLTAMLDRPAGACSGGQQRMVAIARTLLGNPDLLLLDEPSEGLAPIVIDNLLKQLKALKESKAA